MKIAYKTHVGLVRKVNEDSFLVIEEFHPKFLVFAVADGMGGHNAGEVASKMIIQGIKDFFVENHNNDIKIFNIERVCREIEKINKDIYQKSQTNPKFNGMGTTLTLVISFNEEIQILHVGDSRVYKINSNTMKQLTEDHSLVAELIREGRITKKEAKIHPQKNVITRAIGTDQSVKLDVFTYEVNQEDKILLCTDGLVNSVSENTINTIINENINFQEKAEKLIKRANENGGKDNITAIIFQS